MSAAVISLAEARAAHQARETMQSIRAEFEAHMHRGVPETSSDLHFAKCFEILTRLWACRRENEPPPSGGSRVEGAA